MIIISFPTRSNIINGSSHDPVADPRSQLRVDAMGKDGVSEKPISHNFMRYLLFM
jgi:hypothetical protein